MHRRCIARCTPAQDEAEPAMPPEWMDYETLARLSGRTYEGARQLVAKKRLPTRKRNEPPQKTEVLGDPDAPGIRRSKGGDATPDPSLDASGDHADRLIDTLQRELAYARAELERMRAEHAVELQGLRDDLERTRQG